VLAAFAIAQPLFDLLGRNPTYFVAHSALGRDIVVFAMLLTFVVPAILILLLLMAGCLTRWLGTIVYTTEVLGLTTLLTATIVKRLAPSWPWWLSLGMAVVSAIVVTGLYLRYAPLRSVVSVLSPVIVLFPVLFLLVSPARGLLRTKVGTGVNFSPSANTTPVVLIVLDELPVTSMMDSDHHIDQLRYPNFAFLARQAHWFRNASTVAQSTSYALPAILTGRYPTTSRAPHAGVYPENLFTLLGDSYELRVVEILTQLCPDALNAAQIVRPSLVQRLTSLLVDSCVVYVHIVLPPALTVDLPPIDTTWRGFARRQGKALATDPHSRWGDSEWVFEHFLSQVEPVDRPTLFFLHLNLPHLPWKYLPSGREYGPVAASLRPHGLRGEVWSDDAWEVAQGWQRHLLQVANADRLLGRLIDTLTTTGLFDSSLLIVTADHGASFRPGESRRDATPATIDDVSRVPLLIKLPGQLRGEHNDLNVETIDILPTIADVLELEIPWPVDGRSVLGHGWEPSQEKRIFANDQQNLVGKTVFPANSQDRFEAVTRMLGLFGSGEHPDGLFTIGAHRSLVNRAVNELAIIAPRENLVVQLEDSWAFDNVNPDGRFIPAHIAGRLFPSKQPAAPRHLAIVVNDVIRATTRTYLNQGVYDAFTAMVPEGSFVSGRNLVSVFLIDDHETVPRLTPLPLSSSTTYRLEVSAGSQQWLVTSDGRRIDVKPGVIEGEVVLRTVPLSGWAVDTAERRPAEAVVVLSSNDNFLCAARTERPRPGIASRFGLPASSLCGFSFVLPEALLGEDDLRDLRFLGVAGNQASELEVTLRF
jgi:hypothetical protein